MSASPSPSPSPIRKRRRSRPRDSIEDDEDDHALDAMLVELGIPRTNPKKTAAIGHKSSSVEVIELVTPPRNSPPATKQKKKQIQSDGPSFVDLTTSPSSPRPPPSSSNGYININTTVSQPEENITRVEQYDEVSFSYSPSESPPPFVYSLPPPQEEREHSLNSSSSSPEILSPDLPPTARRQVFPDENRREGAKRARRLSGRLKDLHSETTRSNSGGAGRTARQENGVTDKRTSSPVRSKTCASPPKPKRTTKSSGKSGGSGGSSDVVAVVQMEKALDRSVAGDSIREALKNHVYNGKPVPFTVATAMNCIMPGVIRWERKDSGSLHFSCAIYYEADAFLEMIQKKSYKELVAAVRYLQTLVPKSQGSCRAEEEDEPSKFFVIIEGMDRALIELKKKQKQKKKKGDTVSASSSDTRMIAFADLHEMAFQLFMDMGAHTKFTCDLDATANYVALLTRELVVASSRATALEELLESVPRYNSFRVTHSGATASVCANAWLRMLQVIPGVSEDKAQCLLDHFPTFDSLMGAYRDPSFTRAQKEDLVADKLHDGRIQRALSKRIYSVFCEENPDALI